MLKRAVPLSLISLALAGTVSADPDEMFCTRQTPCIPSFIWNESQENMNSVTVIQQPTDGACTKDKRKINKKLKWLDMLEVGVNPNCKYTIEFNAGSDCKGDKKAYFTPTKFEEGRNNAKIKGKCNNLRTAVSKY